MIFIAYIYCEKSPSINMCEYLKKYCNGVTLCLFINEIPALWREISLALIKTINAIENRKTIARKTELEYYTRFFAERQINHIINEYLKFLAADPNLKLLIIKCYDEAVPCIKKYLENLKNLPDLGCRLAKQPNTTNILNLYLAMLKHHGLPTRYEGIDEIQKVIIGLIGCGDILLRS